MMGNQPGGGVSSERQKNLPGCSTGSLIVSIWNGKGFRMVGATGGLRFQGGEIGK